MFAYKNGNQRDKTLVDLKNFYRNIRSIKIGKANEIYPISAQWVSLSSAWGNDLEVTVTQGLEIDTTKVSTATFSASL